MALPPLVEQDPYLQPYIADFLRWTEKYRLKEKELLGNNSLRDFASGHDYFGLFKTDKGWVFRDWAPNATRIFLVGNFNEWQDHSDYELKRIDNGSWELEMPNSAVHHGDLYSISLYWQGGAGKRIPAWAKRVVQDSSTNIFNAQVWAPKERYNF